MNEKILVINPGTTSTKVAIFQGAQEIWAASIQHDAAKLHEFPSIAAQLDYRFSLIREGIPKEMYGEWAVVVGRGGLLRPCDGGIYSVDESLLSDVQHARYGEHASNLGSMIAAKFAEETGVQACVVDPVTTDEFGPVVRISGVPGVERKCRAHALNIKATARRSSSELGIAFEDSNFVVAHLGGGISIAALKGGRISDVNDGLLGMGPFSPERSGAIPLVGVMDLVRDKGYDETKRIFSKESGLFGYLGTSDLREVESRIENGDEEANLIWEAMVYQIAKEIGAMAAALQGKINGIILTGGLVNSEKLLNKLEDYISFFGRRFIYPGEGEMLALAEGGLRVIRGEEVAKPYGVNNE